MDRRGRYRPRPRTQWPADRRRDAARNHIPGFLARRDIPGRYRYKDRPRELERNWEHWCASQVANVPGNNWYVTRADPEVEDGRRCGPAGIWFEPKPWIRNRTKS